jgi:RecA/RadA recombinase
MTKINTSTMNETIIGTNNLRKKTSLNFGRSKGGTGLEGSLIFSRNR